MNGEFKAVVLIAAAIAAAIEAFRAQSFGWAAISAFVTTFAWDTAELAF